MELEIVLLIGAVGLIGVAAATLWSLRRGRHAARKAQGDLEHARKTGALPPSLYPRINLDLCIGSGSCIPVCPEVDVLALIDGKAAVVNPTSCIGHGECMRACPVNAIELVIGTEKRGIDIPVLSSDFETNVPGLYIVGELGGMGLIYNAMTQALQCMDAVCKQRIPKSDGVHQVLIIGAGPAGIAASLRAMQAGLDVVTVDQETLGGTVLHYPRQKLVMTRPVKLPLYGAVRFGEVRKEQLLETWQDILDKTGLKIRSGVRVDRVQRRDDGIFSIQTSAGDLAAHRVILAMGRRGTPRKLNVPGEDLSKVTYRLLEPERYTGQRCLVVGGGDSAVEAAIALGECGATVHLSYRKGSFSRIKKKNGKRLNAAVDAGQVALMLSSNVAEIGTDVVMLKMGGDVQALPNDYVFIFAGGILPKAFLEGAGVVVETYHGETFAPANR